jgi:hypothetical protein
MGREIKRVPLDFDWPLEKVWEGFLNPCTIEQCEACEGTGSSPWMRALQNEWYHGDPEGGWGWSPQAEATRKAKAIQYNLTQDDVNLLIDEHRLPEFKCWKWVGGPDGKFSHWNRRKGSDGEPYYPTAAQVNAVARQSALLHDSINQWIVCKHRAQQAGYPRLCVVCGGEGTFFPTLKAKLMYEGWEETPIPEGEGWQVWETVSEGSPVSPVFATGEELVEYLVEGGDSWCRSRPDESPPSRSAAEAFVLGAGWVPSGVGIRHPDGSGEFHSGIHSADK